MSCSSSGGEKSITVGGEGPRQVAELVKVTSLEAANRLIQEGDHIFLSVYYNRDQSREEYVLGRLEKRNKPARPIGFGQK